jgi:hypothetical protein
MKIYFRNKAARLKLSSLNPTCDRCPFYVCTPCPFYTPTVTNCDGKGWWVDGESLDIFKV